MYVSKVVMQRQLGRQSGMSGRERGVSGQQIGDNIVWVLFIVSAIYLVIGLNMAAGNQGNWY